MLNKTLAGFFAFFLGMFGVHRFYLGQWFRGALQFASFWGLIILLNSGPPRDVEDVLGIMLATVVIAPILSAIVFWATPKAKWQAKYDKDALVQQNTTQSFAALPPANTKALKAEGIRYYRTNDFDLAIEAFLEAADEDLGDAGTHFNLACSYAQLGQFGEALRHLELSVTFGLPKPERIEKHPALAALRKHASYATFKENNFRRLNLIELTTPAEKPAPEIVEEEVLEDFNRPAEQLDLEDERTPGPDLLEQITRLRELHDAGVLTQKEYQTQKEKLMG
ncbi:MAG: NINE protein [Bacteroidota bacterium]